MDKMPLHALLLQSIPESIIVLSFSLALLGLRHPWHQILVAGTATSVISFLLRLLPLPFGFHSLLQFAVVILIVKAAFKFSLFKSALMAVICGATILTAESIFIPIISYLTRIPIEVSMNDPWLRILFPLPHLIFLAFATYILSRYPLKIKVIKQDIADKLAGFPDNVIFFVFLQLFLLSLGVIALYFYLGRLFPTEEFISVIIFNLLFLLSFVATSVIVLNSLAQQQAKEAKYQAMEEQAKNLNELYNSMRVQRHDYVNHIQAIYGLLQNEEFASAKQYIQTIYRDLLDSSQVFQVRTPEIVALLQAKAGKAERLGVVLHIEADIRFERDLPLPIEKFNEVLGNLLDNALEAASEAEQGTGRVEVQLAILPTGKIIRVSNNGTAIPPEEKDNIFRPGFTTKDSSKHSGLGLYSVKQTVEKYGGLVLVESSEAKGTQVVVLFPYKAFKGSETNASYYHSR